MKKIKGWMAVTLCTAMCICACAAEEIADHPKKPAAVKEEKEKPYQKKLDMVNPSAYDNVMGLDLEEGTTLSVIGKAEGVPYWDEVRRGVEQAVKDINENLGYEGKKQVKVTYSAPDTPDNVDEQVNILDEELARYPAALAIAIADTKACEVQFDLAAESDIPVVAFDSGSDYQGLMAMVSTDNREAAREAAQRLAESVDEKGEVILFIHDSKSESAMSREQGFREELEAKYPEITVAEVCYMDQLSDMREVIAAEMNGGTKAAESGDPEGEGVTGGSEAGGEGEGITGGSEAGGEAEGITGGSEAGGETAGIAGSETTGASGGEEAGGETGKRADRAEEEAVTGSDAVTADMISEEDVIDYLFEKHPEVEGIYATNGDAVKLAVEALERTETKAALIGFDADEEELEALEDGRVEALVLQNPFGMGYAAVVASARAALSMGNEAVVDTGYTWITKKNLKDEQIEKLLY